MLHLASPDSHAHADKLHSVRHADARVCNLTFTPRYTVRVTHTHVVIVSYELQCYCKHANGKTEGGETTENMQIELAPRTQTSHNSHFSASLALKFHNISSIVE